MSLMCAIALIVRGRASKEKEKRKGVLKNQIFKAKNFLHMTTSVGCVEAVALDSIACSLRHATSQNWTGTNTHRKQIQ